MLVDCILVKWSFERGFWVGVWEGGAQRKVMCAVGALNLEKAKALSSFVGVLTRCF